MTTKNNKPNQSIAAPISPDRLDVMNRMIENQQKELEIKAQSIDIEKQRDTNQFEYAKIAIEKQVEISKFALEHELKNRIWLYGVISVIAIILAAIIIYAIDKDHADIAMRILEIVATAVISGFGGYQAGKKKDKTLDSKDVKE